MRRRRFPYGEFADVTAEPAVTVAQQQAYDPSLPGGTVPEPPDPGTVPLDPVDPGSGVDQALTIAGSTTLQNYPAAASGAANGTTLTLSSANGYSDGDEIFVHQTRGDGHYEFARIQGHSGNTLTLRGPLKADYTAGAQAVRGANFTDLTVSGGGVVTAQPGMGRQGGLMSCERPGPCCWRRPAARFPAVGFRRSSRRGDPAPAGR